MLTIEDFCLFVAAYKRQFLYPGQDDAFVLAWRKKLSRFTLAELRQAIEDLATDSRRVDGRWPGLWPKNHCPFLEDWVARKRHERTGQKANVERKAPSIETPQQAVERERKFDRMSLKMGTIDQDEFDRREAERVSMAQLTESTK